MRHSLEIVCPPHWPTIDFIAGPNWQLPYWRVPFLEIGIFRGVSSRASISPAGRVVLAQAKRGLTLHGCSTSVRPRSRGLRQPDFEQRKERESPGEDLFPEALHALLNWRLGPAGPSDVSIWGCVNCWTEPKSTLPLCGAARELFRCAP